MKQKKEETMNSLKVCQNEYGHKYFELDPGNVQATDEMKAFMTQLKKIHDKRDESYQHFLKNDDLEAYGRLSNKYHEDYVATLEILFGLSSLKAIVWEGYDFGNDFDEESDG